MANNISCLFEEQFNRQTYKIIILKKTTVEHIYYKFDL